jgi:aspartyl-tRNA(Asn)/glutamyl-tRNA(Gln) amidotransferase subunit A
MTKTVEDAALMLEVMAGYDPKDATSLNRPIPNYSGLLNPNLKGLRVGIPKEYRIDGLNPEIDQLWDKGIAWLKEQGAEIKEVSLPHTQYALPTYYIIAPAEASSNLARYDGVRYGVRVSDDQIHELYKKTRGAGFGEEVQRRILIGTYVLSAGYYDAYYIKAQKMKRLILNDFNQAFQDVDVILSPTTPTPAFPLGEEPKDPVAMYMNDVLTVPANIAGLPAISVPAGLSEEGLPLGLQLIGPALSEQVLFNAALAIEQAAQFSKHIEDLRRAS